MNVRRSRSSALALSTALYAALSLALFVGGGCGKGVYTRDDLDVSLFHHHNNLRWGRLENAALSVKPEMRGAFLSTWAERMQSLEVTDMDIAGVVMSKDGDTADVVVNVTWVDRATMTVKTSAVQEHWVRTDDGWLADKPPTL